MAQPEYPQHSNLFNDQQVSLPNANAVLILGIFSIPGCCCWGILGLICGIVALVIAKKDLQAYRSMPANYSIGSYNNLKAGRICAIIGISLSVIYLVLCFMLLAIYGIGVLSSPDAMRRALGQ